MENTKGIEPAREDDAAVSTPLTAILLLVVIGTGFLLYQALN
jgi:hypothetical protein